jgi:hypothetical protein
MVEGNVVVLQVLFFGYAQQLCNLANTGAWQYLNIPTYLCKAFAKQVIYSLK